MHVKYACDIIELPFGFALYRNDLNLDELETLELLETFQIVRPEY
jgi:hypothetical protein